jgi:hypothetical protein
VTTYSCSAPLHWWVRVVAIDTDARARKTLLVREKLAGFGRKEETP